ncbi:MAG: dipeptide epimerase [Planctomycetaceae bacterium]
MRIAEFITYHARIPLRKTIRHASYVRSANDTLVVRCRLNDGTEGWGEGLPRPYVTGETIETAWQHLQNVDLFGVWGESFDGLPNALQLCRRFELPPPPPDRRDCFGHSVRCAIELSVLDAVGRAEGVPLSQVASHVPETAGILDAKDQVRYSAALTAESPLREMLRAWKYRYYGFQQLKVKVGMPDGNDEATLRRVRRIVGADMDIRIDANEAWRCDQLEARLAPLLPFNITSVEQPVPHAESDGLADVRARIDVPLMLDESLCSLADGQRAVERGTCDLFNIRISKCGGLVNSLLLAGTAHAAGLGYQLGCQVGETGILSAAGRHFATSVANIRYLEGSFDRFLVKEPLTLEDLTFRRGGFAPALTGPGLGVTVDESAVKRVTVAELHLAPVPAAVGR